MEITAQTKPPHGRIATAHCDGSCPANPGPMGIGFHITFIDVPTSEPGEYVQFGYRLGSGTNNQAEYLALIASLREAHRQNITHLSVFSDSQLMVNQVNGEWEVKDGRLKPLCDEAQGLARMFVTFVLTHVPREENALADRLSKNPTDPSLPPTDIEIPFRAKSRKLSRRQAAMIRWWWVTRRCQNEYRLARIFGGTESHLGRIGRGEQYKDITAFDLPGTRLSNSLVGAALGD